MSLKNKPWSIISMSWIIYIYFTCRCFGKSKRLRPSTFLCVYINRSAYSRTIQTSLVTDCWWNIKTKHALSETTKNMRDVLARTSITTPTCRKTTDVRMGRLLSLPRSPVGYRAPRNRLLVRRFLIPRHWKENRNSEHIFTSIS